jgi:UDP:flavonoid glycosyltransferase YjiC (YdhE family)
MKIGIQTWGSEGDVRPFIALAAGLRFAGHDVTLVVTHITNRDYSAQGASFGVPVRSAGRLAPDLAKRVGEVLVGETNVLKQVGIILRDLFEPAAQDMLAEAKRLCRENDILIGHFLVHPLKTAANMAGKPYISVFLAPLLPSALFPPPGVPHLGKVLNTLLWALGDRIMNSMYLPRINEMRLDAGLPPHRSTMHDAFISSRLNLIASSPALFPPPPDWNDTIQMCGAFHLPEQGEQWQPTEDLRRFIRNGPPPVYMTFGSMGLADPAATETVMLMAEAGRLAGCRTIIQADSIDPGDGISSPDIFYLAHAEHHLVFPQCALVVHHGGAGTSHAASRAGCPSIVVEHATDQAFWGGVLLRAGIAPSLLHRRTVTASVLARTIRTILSSSAMREKARFIGESMRREDGVKRAVELIERQI